MHGDVNYNPHLIHHHLQSQEGFVLCAWGVFFVLDGALYPWIVAAVSFIVQGKRNTGDLTAALK